MRALTPLFLALVGCTLEVPVGAECARVRMSEVMTAGESVEFDVVGSKSDWIELHNPTGAPVDLRGYGLGRAGTGPEDVLREPFVVPPHGDRLLVTTTYVDLCAGPECPPVLVFDTNNDFDELNLWAPDALGSARCQHVAVPDQHWEFSWSHDAASDAWCDTVPTPEEENAPCLCDATDAC